MNRPYNNGFGAYIGRSTVFIWRNVTRASLLRVAPHKMGRRLRSRQRGRHARVALRSNDGRSSFWHKDIKIDYARVLLQSPTAPASSRRKPSFDLCEHCGRTHNIINPIVGVGASTTLKNNRLLQHNGRTHYVRKTFLYGSFCGAFFKKRPKKSNRIPPHNRRARYVR